MKGELVDLKTNPDLLGEKHGTRTGLAQEAFFGWTQEHLTNRDFVTNLALVGLGAITALSAYRSYAVQRSAAMEGIRHDGTKSFSSHLKGLKVHWISLL